MLRKYVVLLAPLVSVRKNKSHFQVEIFEDFPMIKIYYT